MGSSLFALPALNSLMKAGFNVLCIYAQPPRPAGRGQKERRCPVHAFAADEGMDVRTPKSLLDTEVQTNFLTLNQLGKKFGISGERVRKISENKFEEFKKILIRNKKRLGR